MASQIKHKNWQNFGSRFDFDLCFFLKVKILEGALLKKNKVKFSNKTS